MEQFYTEIKEILPEAEVQIIEDSIKVIFNGATFFNTGDVVLLPETHPMFERFANVLTKYSNTHVLILGHTDSMGDDNKNLELSNKRAQNAKKQLLYNNISQYRLSSWGMGEISPAYDNETEDGRARNRRIEFIILYGQD